jgi:exopolysaccharide biosynthesis polyprenyl glycosylphosphotransferase
MQKHLQWKAKTSSLFFSETVFEPAVAREVREEALSRRQRAAKRSLDLAVALTVLVLLLPFLAMVAAAIMAESGRPVIFRQQRGGIGGRPFTILKFRTMRVMENGEEIAQARRSDGRVTRLGRVLRRTSIDELPQLWNVVRGDMSIVGPRPHAIAHDKLYCPIVPGYRERQRVKPGLTGLAQVEGCRGETARPEAMARRVRLDNRYIDEWSFWSDVRIMFRTAGALLFEKDVY